MDLLPIYLAALERCSPERMVREHVDPSMPRNVVAIGKCAGPLLDGVAAVHRIESAFAAVPAGYLLPRARAEVHVGGHPHMNEASFAAGRALVEWVDRHDDVLFLLSGGGSACVEAPLPPLSEQEVAARNAELVASSLPIAEINAARRELSAIKGGKLRRRVRGRCVTLVWSDVSAGRLHDVASGPTITSPDEATLLADNSTLVAAAAGLACNAVRLEEQIEGDVAEAARRLVRRALALSPGQVLVSGGEPVVEVRGDGRGGRCSELAVRFALECDAAGAPPLRALFGSSDGVDGNSGAAGVELEWPIAHLDPAGMLAALARSDSFSAASRLGLPIMIPPTGNNLRDLFLVARD